MAHKKHVHIRRDGRACGQPDLMLNRGRYRHNRRPSAEDNRRVEVLGFFNESVDPRDALPAAFYEGHRGPNP